MVTTKHTRVGIRTKWLPPTNHRPQRIKASFDDGRSVVVSSDSLEGNEAEKHATVAYKLLRKHIGGDALINPVAAAFGQDNYWTWSYAHNKD
tara:strand:+ start:18555 stop:18830 length:276 start_codon:yes stop_codon:yes gene_type:complete